MAAMQISEQDVIIAGGASALVALVRKKWPKVDGGWVWVAMLVAAGILAAAFELLPMLHPRVATILATALGAITVVTGGKGALAMVAGAARSRLASEPVSSAGAEPTAAPALPAPAPPRDTEVAVPDLTPVPASSPPRPGMDLNFMGDPK